MQKRKLLTILGVMLAVVVTSLALVFTVGPKVSAYTENEHDRILVLDDWDDFYIETPGDPYYSSTITWYGPSAKIYRDLLGYEEDGCGGFYGSSEKLSEYDEIHIIIPEGVTVINSWEYSGGGYGNDFLEKVTYLKLPSTLKSIWKVSEFNISSLDIPDGVEYIENSAFGVWHSNMKLQEIIIPESVIEIGEYAFTEIPNLQKIYCEASEKPATWDDYWVSGAGYYEDDEFISKRSAGIVWNCNRTVTFDTVGGNMIENQKVCVDHYVSKPTDPTRKNYVFQYWYTTDENVPFDFENEPVTDNMTLTAKWVKEEFTVTFITTSEQTANFTQTVTYQDRVTLPVTPTKTGYDFSGWYTDENCTSEYNFFASSVIDDFTLYAGWIKHKYNVTFDTDGGSAIDSQLIEYQNTVTRPVSNPTKTGHNFTGWYANETCTTPYDFSTPITENATIYAGWSKKSYTVTFNTNGGTAVANQPVEYNQYVNVPVTTKTGYHLNGWYFDVALTQPFEIESTPITDDITLYANWEINVYQVKFFTVGGSCAATEQMVEHGGHATYQEATKDSYEFLGWFLDGESEPYQFSSREVTSNLDLVAKWRKLPIISFITGVGTPVSSLAVPYSTTITAPVTTSEGYTFLGWYNLANDQKFDFNTPITYDIQLYAKWRDNSKPEEDPTQPENNETPSTTVENKNNGVLGWVIGLVLAGVGAAGTVAGVVVAKKRRK